VRGPRDDADAKPPAHPGAEAASSSTSSPPGIRSRWLPVAAVLVLIAAVGVAVPWMVEDDPGRPDQPVQAMVPAPSLAPLPAPSVAPLPATPSAAPTTPGRTTPSRTKPNPPGDAGAPRRPQSAPRTTKPASAPRRTTASPKPSLSVSTSGSHCTGWRAGHGWTIHVAVTVHNGRGRSATGTHGYDRNVGGTGTYRLSGGGTSFSGELPPDLGDNPELTQASVTWSVTVQLEGGGTLTKSGTAYRPSSC